MTETELLDRLREAIVLDGPDVWRTNGYLQEAQQAGLSLADALKKANEVGQEISNNSILFQNIRARIARLAHPSRAHLIDQDLNQIVNAAASLKLSPDFVKNTWVPAVLKEIQAASTPPRPEPPAAVVPAIEPTPAPEPDKFDDLLEAKPEPPTPKEVAKPIVIEPVVAPPVPVVPPPVEVTTPPPVPPKPEKPPIVRSFTATPARVRKGQPVTLEWDVENLLAVTIDDLGEGLSPKNRGWVKPSKTSDYTLFDANNNPLSTVRVEVIKPDRSGIYGVLFALALLAIIYWFIKSSNSQSEAPRPKQKTEQTTRRKLSNVSQPKPEASLQEAPVDTPEETAAETVATDDSPIRREEPAPHPTDESLATTSEPEPKPASPADARAGKYEEAFGDKPYDKVELGTDEMGWRRARSKGRWGYVNQNDEWVIQPEYEAITPFRGNTASVFLNGQLMTINRTGEQVRN